MKKVWPYYLLVKKLWPFRSTERDVALVHFSPNEGDVAILPVSPNKGGVALDFHLSSVALGLSVIVKEA